MRLNKLPAVPRVQGAALDLDDLRKHDDLGELGGGFAKCGRLR